MKYRIWFGAAAVAALMAVGVSVANASTYILLYSANHSGTTAQRAIKAAHGNGYRLATVDATAIARKELGLPITNTTMIGALLKASGLVDIDTVIGPLEHRFGRVANKNIAAMKSAYEQTVIL